MNLPNNVISLEQYRAQVHRRVDAQRAVHANERGFPLPCRHEEEAYQEVLFQLLKEQGRRRRKLIVALSVLSLAVLAMILIFCRAFSAHLTALI